MSIDKIINNTTNLDEINDILHDVKRQKIKILNAYWEKLYKDRCPNTYLSLTKTIDEITFWNEEFNEISSLKINKFLNEKYYFVLDHLDISTLLSSCESYDFKQLGTKFPQMICEACVCENCSFMKECRGNICADCKKNFYNMYSGYCDE